MRRLLALAVALVALAPGVAVAHGDTGTMEVLVASADRIEVGLLHLDGAPADQATIRATVRHADGTTIGPVPLVQVSGGRYGADVELPKPGTWTVEVRATGPTAAAALTFEVAELPTPTGASAEAGREAALQGGDDGGEGGWGGIAVAALAIAAVAVAVLAAGRRRRA